MSDEIIINVEEDNIEVDIGSSPVLSVNGQTGNVILDVSNSILFAETISVSGKFLTTGTISSLDVPVYVAGTKPGYRLEVANRANFDPGEPFTVDGRARVVHGMTFQAGIPNFTNGSDHSHVFWSAQGRRSWQMIQNGGLDSDNSQFGENNIFQLTTPMNNMAQTRFNELQIHSVDTTDIVTNVNTAPYIATNIKINYNTNTPILNVGQFCQLNFNLGFAGIVASTYVGRVLSGPTSVQVNGQTKFQYTFQIEGLDNIHWLPSIKGLVPVTFNSALDRMGLIVLTGQQIINGTQTGLTGNYLDVGRYVLVGQQNHNAYVGAPVVLSINTDPKIGLLVRDYNAYVKDVIDSNHYMISVGNAFLWPNTSGTTGAGGWTVQKGSTDGVHQYTPATQHFWFQRFKSNDTNTVTTGGSRAVALGSGAETNGYFTYALGYNSSILKNTTGPALTASSVFGGSHSFVQGSYATALGGERLIIKRDNQTALGKFNNPDTEALLVIGNGSSQNNRSNILEAHTNKLSVSGSLETTGSILSAGVNLFDIFSTTATGGSQSLSFDESNQELSISGGNAVSLSSIKVATTYTISSLNSNTTLPAARNRQITYTLLSPNLSLTLPISGNQNGDLYRIGVSPSSLLNSTLTIFKDFGAGTQILITLKENQFATFLYTNALGWSINEAGNINFNNSYEWDSVYNNVNSLSSNWFSASAASVNYTHANFLPLTGGTLSGETRFNNNVTIFGNLSCSGTQTFANTIFSTTSSLSVVHFGSGPALYVGNNGDGDIASFYDIDQGVEILHVGGNNSSHPNVGIKTSTPNATLTVNGEISATSDIYARFLNLKSDTPSDQTRINLIREYDNPSGSNINFIKRRSSSLNTFLSANDILGSINFLGQFFAGASIEAKVDGLSQNNLSSPTSLSFSTGTSGINTNTTRMTIRSSGNVGINTTNPNERLTVLGNVSSSNVIYDSAGNSNEWNSVYNNVNSLSSSWEESADIIPTVTNYLSTNNVLLSSIDVADRIILDNQLYYVAPEDGQYLGRTKIKENNLRLTNIGSNWIVRVNVSNLTSICMTVDGRSQMATESSGTIYNSNDYGKTWSTAPTPSIPIVASAMSSDGKHRTVVRGSSDAFPSIYVSNDYGASFSGKGISDSWSSVAMSSDGKYQTTTSTNAIYISNDYGNTWKVVFLPEGLKPQNAVAMSSTGKHQSVLSDSNRVYISNDFGKTWTSNIIFNSANCIAMSSDGRYQYIATNTQIWRSINFGLSWTLTPASLDLGNTWKVIATSSDGKFVTASSGVNATKVYVSRTHGLEWETITTTSGNWTSIAISSDAKYQTIVSSGVNAPILTSTADDEVEGDFNIIGSLNYSQPYGRFTINGNFNLSDLFNSVEYIIPWNTEFNSDPSIIETLLSSDNMYIKKSGTYHVKARFSCYNMFDASDYLRIRLRTSTSGVIGNVNAGSLNSTLAWRFAGGTLLNAGEMYVEGDVILNITQPTWVATTILGSGGNAQGGSAFYPFYDNSQGTLPYMEVRKIA